MDTFKFNYVNVLKDSWWRNVPYVSHRKAIFYLIVISSGTKLSRRQVSATNPVTWDIYSLSCWYPTNFIIHGSYWTNICIICQKISCGLQDIIQKMILRKTDEHVINSYFFHFKMLSSLLVEIYQVSMDFRPHNNCLMNFTWIVSMPLKHIIGQIWWLVSLMTVFRELCQNKGIYMISFSSVIKNERKIIFLDAPDEIKKTFLTTAILTEVKRQEK